MHQSKYRYTIRIGAGNTKFDLVKFNYVEKLSELFFAEVELASFQDQISFRDILDKRAVITFYNGDEKVRFISGIVTNFARAGRKGFYRSLYTCRLEPSVSRLTLTSDCRSYQNKTVPEIMSEVLQEHNIHNFEIKAMDGSAVPQKRELLQQYRETHWDFLQRISREEGFYFYIEHTDKIDIIHYINNTQGAPRIKERFLCNLSPSGDRPEPCIWKADYGETLRPTSQVLKDYTFTHPEYHLSHKVVAEYPNEREGPPIDYEKFDFPGRFKFDEAGKPFTKTRLRAERREAKLMRAEGDDMRVIPGYRIKLEEHPVEEYNTEWLVTEVVHEATQYQILEEEAGDQGSYYKAANIKLVPWDTQWRAMPMYKPRVDGPQMATVTGPPGEEIYCDRFGRVRIKFSYDRSLKSDDSSSCWVRVSQGWAGKRFGFMSIPRIGQEVIVDYIEGDPDQPIITGRTANVLNLPAYELPKHKTRTWIKTDTHKGGGKGFNELRFEDEADQEEIFIHAQKDQNNVVKHNETTEVGNDRSEHVGHDEKIDIGRNRAETVGKHEKTTIGGNQTELIKRNKAETIAIAKALTVGAAYQVSVGAAMNQTVGLSKTQQIGKNKRVDVGNKIHVKAGDEIVLETGKAKITMKSDGSIKLEGTDIKNLCDCEFKVNAKNDVIIKGKKVKDN